MLAPVILAYKSGDTAGAVDGFLRHVCGDEYPDDVVRVLPDAPNGRSPAQARENSATSIPGTPRQSDRNETVTKGSTPA